ncbi:MAG: NAD(P)/FAD-dependent oxidoreductase [Myxococcota bacterium]
MSRHIVVLGGGHNGLVCAAYLARAGARVTLLERREILGGACVTEELWPGYRVSRAAYVLSLFRPRILRDLRLDRFGLELLPRSPSSLTPLVDGRSLVLGPDTAMNLEEIGRFSSRDAAMFPHYESFLARIAAAVEPTLDAPPPEWPIRRPRDLTPWWLAGRAALRLRRDLPRAARLFLASARELLEEYFESEPLRATLATDAVIGAFAGPSTPGTGYVLFHHVMGSTAGRRGVWAYVRGGMGALTDALAGAAGAAGAELRTGAEVAGIRTHRGAAAAVLLASGEEIAADAIVSSADLERTTRLLDEPALLPEPFVRSLRGIDYRSPVIKMNLALGALPRFRCRDRDPAPLGGTIHIGPCDLDAIDRAFEQARTGDGSECPLVELTIPSVLDDTLAPPGRQVASIFAQYAPVLAAGDPGWPELRSRMRERILAAVDAVAPGFSGLIEHEETLVAPDMERIFGLTGGNIFHGAMTPDRLLFMRPVPGWSRYKSPVECLYLCGAATHPGGGVMGASGRNAAREIARDLRL